MSSKATVFLSVFLGLLLSLCEQQSYPCLSVAKTGKGNYGLSCSYHFYVSNIPLHSQMLKNHKELLLLQCIINNAHLCINSAIQVSALPIFFFLLCLFHINMFFWMLVCSCQLCSLNNIGRSSDLIWLSHLSRFLIQTPAAGRLTQI